MASVLAEAAVKKACELAANQVSIVYNFREDLELLENRVMEINSVLDEAEEESTSCQKELGKRWLHRVRDIAWEAEDILEEFSVDSLYARNSHLSSFTCTQLFLRLKLGRRIQKVKDRFDSVVSDGNKLNIVRSHALPRRPEVGESSTSHEHQFRGWSVLPSDSKPVAIDSKIERINSLLENPDNSIIAAVGMGGIGKTYLLQHVYNERKDRYDKSAWLSVSQSYSVSKLQRDLAFQLDKNLSKDIMESGVSVVLAAESIYKFMERKRCLIVLDDVWTAAREGNLLTKLGIPIGGNNTQCKILVSTRNKEVCGNLNAEIYEVERLTDEESWRLFCAHAFPRREENGPPKELKKKELEKVAREIEKKCGNLPLAIKVVAASLGSRVELSDWQFMFDKMKKVGTFKKYDYVINILKLSYNSLPAHLKSCFAYFSFFPQDAKIDCEYLMYLWTGEGFILERHNPWDCLRELANLCLVEVWEEECEEIQLSKLDISKIFILKKYCRIHDLLLDLAIDVSRENKCAFSVEDAFSKGRGGGGVRWCRLFLAKREIDNHAISQMHPVSPTLVRTLSLSGNLLPERNISAALFSGMRVLRVLDLSHTNISALPACVGEMKLLKVLNLSFTNIEKLPKCVRRLKSLSYLNISDYISLRQTPKWIGELRCLQHLEGRFWRLTKAIMKVRSLRTLRTPFPLILSDNTSMLSIKDVGKMSENLEEISFILSDESQLKRMEEGILARLKKMRRLIVIAKSKLDHPQFPESMSAMKDLEHLRLVSFAVPRWICCLTNLVSSSLSGNKTCRELPKEFGKSGGFPHLRFFSIIEFDELEEFPEIEDGGMPCLEKLRIQNCEKLNKVGEGLERPERLKQLYFWNVGSEVMETFKEGGTYWTKIKDLNPQVAIITM